MEPLVFTGGWWRWCLKSSQSTGGMALELRCGRRGARDPLSSFDSKSLVSLFKEACRCLLLLLLLLLQSIEWRRIIKSTLWLTVHCRNNGINGVVVVVLEWVLVGGSFCSL